MASKFARWPRADSCNATVPRQWFSSRNAGRKRAMKDARCATEVERGKREAVGSLSIFDFGLSNPFGVDQYKFFGLAWLIRAGAMGKGDIKFRDGRIVRGEDPLNLEMPFSTLDSFITPTESFYVRTHFPIPSIDRDAWWLRVEGDVENPFAINYEQLLELESMTVPVTLECAGNNRNFLEPKVKGVQWRLGAVGTAEWTGVSLSVLLDRAKPKPQASEVVLEGADGGILEDPKSPPGKLHFARSIPLEKARADVLLAYKMNGSDLPSEHGFPVRAIVPGWYAVASVKWLQRIIVTDQPFTGYYQTIDYAYWKRREQEAELTPVAEVQIKAEIAKPAEG